MSDDLLKKLRKSLEGVDRRIVKLLDQRAAMSVEIGKFKEQKGLEVYDPFQEAVLYRNILEYSGGILPETSLRDIYREIVSSSRELQKPAVAAYLGPEASFSHQATLTHFGNGMKAVPKKTVADVFDSVEKGETQWGMVPIENSAEGSVKPTLDRLIVTPLFILAEVFLRIRHCLLSRQSELANIKRIYSHPQALAQCQDWIRKQAPGIPLIEVESTAGAAMRVQEDMDGAAVASSFAGSRYGLEILAEGIEDSPFNTTRFLVIGQKPVRWRKTIAVQGKTSILFGTSHVPGALQRALAPFAEAGINLTRIESWPMRERIWEYLFFVDFVGHAEEEKTKNCLEGLECQTAFLKILGSYPSGVEKNLSSSKLG
jgi:chorismate mutase / prephenate dehydratase